LRDPGLEELIEDELGDEPGLSQKKMFGGIAWMHWGNLLCGASDRGLMLRLGKGNDAWALELDGVTQMVSSQPMQGWIHANEDVYGDDELRRKLFAAALDFVRTLPPKSL
jgi:hypothetical protein